MKSLAYLINTTDAGNVESFKVRNVNNNVETYSCKSESFLRWLGEEKIYDNEDFDFWKQKKISDASYITIDIKNNDIILNEKFEMKLPEEYSVVNEEIVYNNDLCYNKFKDGYYPVKDAQFILDIPFKVFENPSKKGLYVYCRNGKALYGQNGII